jgi:hypothetical protein
MDKAHKPNDFGCYTPTSEPFRFDRMNEFSVCYLLYAGLLLVLFFDSENGTKRRMIFRFRFRLYCYRRCVGQFVLVSGSHLWPTTRFLLLSDIFGLLVVGRPSRREDGSVIYSYNSLSLSSPSPEELWPYLTFSSETPQTWRARSPYLYPPGTGWPSYTTGYWVGWFSLY